MALTRQQQALLELRLQNDPEFQTGFYKSLPRSFIGENLEPNPAVLKAPVGPLRYVDEVPGSSSYFEEAPSFSQRFEPRGPLRDIDPGKTTGILKALDRQDPTGELAFDYIERLKGDPSGGFYEVVPVSTPKFAEFQQLPESEIKPILDVNPTAKKGVYGYTTVDVPSGMEGEMFQTTTNPVYLAKDLADFITTKPMSPANQLRIQTDIPGYEYAKPEDLLKSAVQTVQHEYAHNITKFPQFKDIIKDAVNIGIPSDLKLKGKPGDALSKYDLEELFTRAIDIERMYRKDGDLSDPSIDIDLAYIQSVLDKKYKESKNTPYSSAISYINAIRPTVINYFDKIEEIVRDQSLPLPKAPKADRPTVPTTGGGGSPAQMAKTAAETRRKDLQQMRGPIGRDDGPSKSTTSTKSTPTNVGNPFGYQKGGRVGYALGSPEPLNVSNEEKRIAFDLYQALKDIEEQYTGETIAGDPSPQNLDPSDRRQGTLMAGGDFPEFETYADVIDAYNSGVAVEPGESLTDYIKRNNIKIKEIEMDPLDDLKKVELVDELEPGPLKDELKEKFDPSQETYEEYLRRINLDRPFNAADGGRAKFQDGLSVQTLDPLFPTQDPTSTDFKPLDLPGAIIPPLAIGAGAKRLKDIFLSKDEGDDKKEIVPSDDKGSNIEPPKGPKFDDLAQDFLVEEAVERLKKKEMDVDKRTDKTLLARDLDLDIPKSGLYDLRKDENFFNNRLKFLKKKGVNFDGYYSTPEIANLLGIKTGSGVRDFVVRKNVPMVKKGLFNVLTLNDFLKSYNPTRERILEAPEENVRTKARTDFLSEAGGSIYQKFKDLRVPKNLPKDVKQIYDKYNLTEVEGGHPFPVEFFTKKYGKGNTLQNKRQFDWIYRNRNKLFDKDNLVFQSKDVNTLFRDSINQLKKQYEILSPLVDKYEGKGAVKNKKDIATIEAANNAIMEIIAKSEFDAKKFIKNNPNSVNISRMKEGGLHGALFNTDTGEVSLYTGAGEGAGFVKGAASEDKLDSKLKLAGDYVDIISKVITDEDDKKMFENYINEKILPRFQKGGIVSLMA